MFEYCTELNGTELIERPMSSDAYLCDSLFVWEQFARQNRSPQSHVRYVFKVSAAQCSVQYCTVHSLRFELPMPPYRLHPIQSNPIQFDSNPNSNSNSNYVMLI